MSRNFITKSKKNPLFSHENSGFLVRVAGFEPTASWTRTKRDTKLRHTRMLTPAALWGRRRFSRCYYNDAPAVCQVRTGAFPGWDGSMRPTASRTQARKWAVRGEGGRPERTARAMSR